MDRIVDNTIASCTFVSATFLATYTTDIYLLSAITLPPTNYEEPEKNIFKFGYILSSRLSY
jgi:hypothetical protein